MSFGCLYYPNIRVSPLLLEFYPDLSFPRRGQYYLSALSNSLAEGTLPQFRLLSALDSRASLFFLPYSFATHFCSLSLLWLHLVKDQDPRSEMTRPSPSRILRPEMVPPSFFPSVKCYAVPGFWTRRGSSKPFQHPVNCPSSGAFLLPRSIRNSETDFLTVFCQLRVNKLPVSHFSRLSSCQYHPLRCKNEFSLFLIVVFFPFYFFSYLFPQVTSVGSATDPVHPFV